jgi:hypothetical protein
MNREIGKPGDEAWLRIREEENAPEPPEIDYGLDLPDEGGGQAEKSAAAPFDPTRIQIQMRQDTFRNLIERLERGEIDMNTDFQRHADLWSDEKMSRLIESILIRFPLPALYFDATNDGRWLVVDGLQRLSSIRKFVLEKRLALSGLEYLKELNGVKYDALSRSHQRRIHECPVTLYTIMPGTPGDVKYSVFRRINTGGLVMNDQEIRNALAGKREREYLEALSLDPDFIAAVGDQSRRMQDQELVLRFIAFYKRDYLGGGKNLAGFLDDAMGYLAAAADAELGEIAGAFRRAAKTCLEIFGDSAFEKWDGESRRRRRKSAALFEAWMVGVARLSETEAASLAAKKEKVRGKHMELIGNETFYRSVTQATRKREHVRLRFDMTGSAIKEVLDA